MLAVKSINLAVRDSICCPVPMPIDEGLAMEQRLLDQVCSGEIPRGYAIWRSEQALVVPRSATHKPGFEHASRRLGTQGWPVTVRSTGGELTPQTRGFINLSLVVRGNQRRMGIRESYALVCQPLIRWMTAMGINAYCSAVEGAFCDGDFNLVVNGRKIVGTAQRRKRLQGPRAYNDDADTAILVHAVILCDEDLDRVWKVSNEFYKACRLPPFIIGNRHICLAELLGQAGEEFIERMMRTLDGALRRHLDLL